MLLIARLGAPGLVYSVTVTVHKTCRSITVRVARAALPCFSLAMATNLALESKKLLKTVECWLQRHHHTLSDVVTVARFFFFFLGGGGIQDARCLLNRRLTVHVIRA
jgi:hypothetical protein